MNIRPIQIGAMATIMTLLAGCAQSPIPVSGNFELTEQKKVRSSGHWQLVSRDAVKETLKMLDGAGIPASAKLYVTPGEAQTAFDKAFHEFITTELVRSGRFVSHEGQGSVKLSYKTQLVVHKSPRPHFVPGIYTAVTAGVSALYGLSKYHVDTQLMGGLALAGAADFGSSTYSGGPTHTELVLTTSATTVEQFLTRKTDVYYIEDVDHGLFEKNEFKQMKVVNQ